MSRALCELIWNPIQGDHVVEHRGVLYEIKIARGRSQWTWIVHTSPKPKQGSIEGASPSCSSRGREGDKIGGGGTGRSAARIIEDNRRHNQIRAKTVLKTQHFVEIRALPRSGS